MKISYDYVLVKAILVVFVSVLLASCTSTPTTPDNSATTAQVEITQPSIEGTYRLVSREMQNGTILQEPDAIGLLTFTKTRRNFNIAIKDDTGLTFDSRVSEYRLTPTDYSEMDVFAISNDEANRDRFVYTRTETTKSVPVKFEGNHIEFQPEGEPVLVFEGTKITATSEGLFTDVWEKVE
jgi:hypothetical protein